MITDDELQQLHPLMRARVLEADRRISAAGGALHAVSVTRSYALQKTLRYLYVSGQRNIEAADPDALGEVTPWGWRIRGSAHLVQPEDPDGCSWAIDLAWTGISDADAVGVLDDCGLRQTVDREIWHYQCFAGGVLFDGPVAPNPPRQLTEEPPMHIHPSTPRPDVPHTYDVMYLPADGTAVGGFVCHCSVLVRPVRPQGRLLAIEVFSGGASQGVTQIDPNGATVAVPIRTAGLVSVVGVVELLVEGRELWLPA